MSPVICINSEIRRESTLIRSAIEDNISSECVQKFVEGMIQKLEKCSTSSNSLSAALELMCTSLHSIILDREIRCLLKNLASELNIVIAESTLNILLPVLFQMFLNSSHGANVRTPPKEVVELGIEDEQVLRYVCGYIPYKLIKRYRTYDNNEGAKICIEILKKWSVPAESEANSYISYSRKWIDQVSRGGIFTPNTQVFKFFSTVECEVRGLLRLADIASLSKINLRAELYQRCTANYNIESQWAQITPRVNSKLVSSLKHRVLNEYIQLRCKAFCRSYMMFVKKQSSKVSKSKEKSLRKKLAKKSDL